MSWTWLVGVFYLATAVVPPQPGSTETIRVSLKLRTGGSLAGLVVDHNEHGLVVVHEDTPYVFAWEEVEPGSAYGTRRALLVFRRSGEDRLSGEDHFQLGLFALRHGRKDLAGREFGRAIRQDPDFRPLVEGVVNEHRQRATVNGGLNGALSEEGSAEDTEPDRSLETVAEGAKDAEESPPRGEGAAAGRTDDPLAPGLSAASREQVLDAYMTFGAKVQELIGKEVVLVESEHFLIWTDWERRHRDQLASWCESMYAALCEQFDLDLSDNVFLAKCPVFCWRSKARFMKFARLFDGYSGTNAVGYTRSIEANGHVHVVLLRQGRFEADFNRFACTLVHEGTHAFVHRLHSPRLIPHWVNEGYADLMAERVLGDRCPNGENARLLARQFVRFGWPMGSLLYGVGPIEVHQYPLAHSVVAYLEGLGRDRFAGFIEDLKSGRSVAEALATRYEGLTLEQLEDRWRSSTQSADPAGSPTVDRPVSLPWSTDRRP
jgi:hypothetical protein